MKNLTQKERGKETALKKQKQQYIKLESLRKNCWPFTNYVYFTIDEEALPGGSFFALMVLFVLCVLCGKVAEKFKAPPLLGNSMSFLHDMKNIEMFIS